jgi:ribosomal protein L29
MKISELRNLSQGELLEKEKSLKEELFKLNMQRYGGRVEKPHLFSFIKRDIARIQTILNPVRNTKAITSKNKISNGVNEKKSKTGLADKETKQVTSLKGEVDG